MNKYELLETVGEGAYGIVIKARNKESGDLVAIKRFKESEEDEAVRKTTLREVKLLRNLRDAPFVVKLIEAFRRKGRLYLVFEFVGPNLLELLETHPNGLQEKKLRVMVFTMLLSIYACHTNSVIHRDVKPENLLVADDGTLRLCDFGFARQYSAGARDLTDYVATRWYRSPELLLGTTDYSLPTDLFASGCIMAELIDGQPLFPGESELDQMHLIQKLCGGFTAKQQEAFQNNSRFAGHRLSGAPVRTEALLERKFGTRIGKQGVNLLTQLLAVDPAKRPTVAQALQHSFFDGLADIYCPAVKNDIAVAAAMSTPPFFHGGAQPSSAGPTAPVSARSDLNGIPSIGSRPPSSDSSVRGPASIRSGIRLTQPSSGVAPQPPSSRDGSGHRFPKVASTAPGAKGPMDPLDGPDPQSSSLPAPGGVSRFGTHLPQAGAFATPTGPRRTQPLLATTTGNGPAPPAVGGVYPSINPSFSRGGSGGVYSTGAFDRRGSGVAGRL